MNKLIKFFIILFSFSQISPIDSGVSNFLSVVMGAGAGMTAYKASEGVADEPARLSLGLTSFLGGSLIANNVLRRYTAEGKLELAKDYIDSINNRIAKFEISFMPSRQSGWYASKVHVLDDIVNDCDAAIKILSEISGSGEEDFRASCDFLFKQAKKLKRSTLDTLSLARQYSKLERAKSIITRVKLDEVALRSFYQKEDLSLYLKRSYTSNWYLVDGELHVSRLISECERAKNMLYSVNNINNDELYSYRLEADDLLKSLKLAHSLICNDYQYSYQQGAYHQYKRDVQLAEINRRQLEAHYQEQRWLDDTARELNYIAQEVIDNASRSRNDYQVRKSVRASQNNAHKINRLETQVNDNASQIEEVKVSLSEVRFDQEKSTPVPTCKPKNVSLSSEKKEHDDFLSNMDEFGDTCGLASF